ncbi:MAG: hypothetical protein HY700_01925 [Gemmatimonadetes bacterium]|nr:hypothetical protein [Gemmatimonadota bacterium]
MKTLNISVGLVTAIGLLGCANGNGPNGSVSLSFAGRSANVTAAPAAFSSPAGSSAADVLVITKAEVVLRQIELKAVEVANCDVVPKPENCEEFQTGPVRLNIPTTTGASTQVTVDIPPGTYKEVDFEVHKLTTDASEAAFAAANPDLVGKSIVVTGTFNGQAFTFTSDLDVEQELTLVPNLVITASTTSTNLTVQVNLGDWFKTTTGTLINPATANKGGANESVVKENIKRSMKAFEDKDRDGNEG